MRTETIEAKRKVTPEAQIRRRLDDWVKAVRAKEIDGIMALYASDVVSFDAIAQLQFKGADAYRAHWQACNDMCEGPMLFELHELTVAADGDLAFCHYLVHCGGTNKEGEEQSGWTRATACWRRTEDKWMVVHEHFSAPFDMASGKAMFDLEP